MASKLSVLLTDLRAGKEITVGDSGSDRIPGPRLRFEDGRWMLWQAYCWSSEVYGGTCRCVSHEPSGSEEISRKEALEKLRATVRAEVQGELVRQAEIAWLDKAISELTD